MAGVRAVSPAEVHEAAARLEAALLETKRWDLTSWMDTFNAGTPEQGAIEQQREGTLQLWIADQRRVIAGYVETVLGLDPQWFQDQAAAHSRAESLIRLSVGDPPGGQGDAAELTEALATVERTLGSWQGEGAEAFATQLQRVRDFDTQQANLLVQLGLAMIAGRDAVMATRASFVSVCDDAAAAAAAYRATEEQRDAKVTAFIVVGILAAALTLVAAGAAPGGVGLASYVLSWGGGGAAVGGQIVSTGNSIFLTKVPSDDLDAVTTGFATNADRVVANLDVELTAIATKCGEFDQQYGPGARLLLPLPASTDVHAPDYTYDALRSEDHPPGAAFDRAVRDQATRSAPVPADGAIGRALNPR